MKTNAVKLSPDEQYQIRKSIVRLLKKGKANGEIAEILDVSERHVRSVKKQYAEGGLAALKPKKRGRSIGEKRILTPEQEKEVLEMAQTAYQAIDGTGLARVDFLMDKHTGKLYINEINTMPGFTKYSMFPLLWQETGMTYAQLIERIVELGYERYHAKNRG